jgi:hypothetical protein
MRGRLCLVLLVLASCSGQARSEDVFTLYRDSPLGQEMRIHVATFDSADGKNYNQENCRLAADLFQAQPGVTARFWCEMGHFRK